MERIADSVLDRAVDGTGLHEPADRPATLRDQLDPTRPTLVLFLRHFGCLLCREMVKEVRIASDEADSIRGPSAGDERAGERRYPRVAFVHQATEEQGAQFFGRYWPGAIAISDPQKALYADFGLERASLGQLFGPRVWPSGVRATLKGHTLGWPAGDVRTLPGLFLLAADGRLLHQHLYAHVGDHPDFARFADLAKLVSSDSPRGASGGSLPFPALGVNGQ